MAGFCHTKWIFTRFSLHGTMRDNSPGGLVTTRNDVPLARDGVGPVRSYLFGAPELHGLLRAALGPIENAS